MVDFFVCLAEFVLYATVSFLCWSDCIFVRDKCNYFIMGKYFQINLKHTFIPFRPYSICFMRSFFPQLYYVKIWSKKPWGVGMISLTWFKGEHGHAAFGSSEAGRSAALPSTLPAALDQPGPSVPDGFPVSSTAGDNDGALRCCFAGGRGQQKAILIWRL